MARSRGPWDEAGAQRRRRQRRFLVTLGLVAVAAFTVTLKWPSSEQARALASTVSATASTPVSLAPPFPAQPTQTTQTTQARAPRAQAAPGRFGCTVASITDGDTLRCADGTRVRLHAVAARETDESCSPGHPCPAGSAAAATAALRRLAGGRALSCEPTGRSYGRVTAVCWTPSGQEINCAMVRGGTAVVWDRFNRERPLCQG